MTSYSEVDFYKINVYLHMFICINCTCFAALEAIIPEISIAEGPLPTQRTVWSLYRSGVRKSWLCWTGP